MHYNSTPYYQTKLVTGDFRLRFPTVPHCGRYPKKANQEPRSTKKGSGLSSTPPLSAERNGALQRIFRGYFLFVVLTSIIISLRVNATGTLLYPTRTAPMRGKQVREVLVERVGDLTLRLGGKNEYERVRGG